jgi:hypothetical protein
MLRRIAHDDAPMPKMKTLLTATALLIGFAAAQRLELRH